MGCTSSKQMKSTVDIYRPAPASFAVFDINAIQEPWLIVNHAPQEHQEKPSHVPSPILEKLHTFEADTTPHSWVEVSKALEDLKPKLQDHHHQPPPPTAKSAKPELPAQDSNAPNKQTPRKSLSFHTLEELDAKLKPSSTKKPAAELRKTESMRTELETATKKITELKTKESEGGLTLKPVKENIFILRDRLEREREGKATTVINGKRDPLSEYPEKCPPGGAEAVVLYTTSLRGVRRTYEDCNRLREMLEGHGVVLDERNVALHGEFLSELKELVGEHVPRVFVKGRYIGGVEEVEELNETGRLGRILRSARVERGLGRQACEGCGGARFVPCLECGGSCKVVVVMVNGDKKERCGKCNENGLVHCPICN